MKENTSGLPGLTSMVNINAPAIILYFLRAKNLDSIPDILSALPGSLFNEWMATLMRTSLVGWAARSVLASAEDGELVEGGSIVRHTLSILGPWILSHIHSMIAEK